MPLIEVHVIAGYDSTAKRRLGAALTDAVRSVVPAPLDGTTVLIHEVAPDGYMRGRDSKSPAPPLPDPEAVVRGFLGAMEARDLATAEAYLCEGFTMTFPGDVQMTTLSELIAWAKPRYTRVSKTYERFDVCPAPDATIVYCFGTLSGEWLDQSSFGGIRFVDRFELVAGKIIRQDVWNDLSEARLGRDAGET